MGTIEELEASDCTAYGLLIEDGQDIHFDRCGFRGWGLAACAHVNGELCLFSDCHFQGWPVGVCVRGSQNVFSASQFMNDYPQSDVWCVHLDGGDHNTFVGGRYACQSRLTGGNIKITGSSFGNRFVEPYCPDAFNSTVEIRMPAQSNRFVGGNIDWSSAITAESGSQYSIAPRPGDSDAHVVPLKLGESMALAAMESPPSDVTSVTSSEEAGRSSASRFHVRPAVGMSAKTIAPRWTVFADSPPNLADSVTAAAKVGMAGTVAPSPPPRSAPGKNLTNSTADAPGEPRITATATQSTGRFNVKDYGAKGDGTWDDKDAIQRAVAATGGHTALLYFPAGTYIIGDSLSISKDISLEFEPGAILSVGAGATVSLSFPENIIAGLRQRIFKLAETGAVNFVGGDFGYYLGTVYPHWWGAEADYATDDTLAIQAALDAAPDPANAALSRGLTVFFPRGYYKFSTLSIPGRTVLLGDEMWGGSCLHRIAGSTGTAIEDKGYAIAIHLRHIGISCNHCVGDGLKLGMLNNIHSPGGHNVWGWNGLLDRVRVTGAVGKGIHVHTNGNSIRNIQTTSCQGSIVTGAATKIVTWHDASQDVTDPTRPQATPYGLQLNGTNMTLHGFHGEGFYSTAALNINVDGATLSGIDCTVGAGRTLPAVVHIENYKDACSVFGIQAYAHRGPPDGVIACLIKDESYPLATRIVTGTLGSAAPTRIKYWDEYHSGRQRNGLLSGMTPPTNGQWLRGDFLRTEAYRGFPAQFICTAAGSPGTWAPVGTLPGALAKTIDYSVRTTDNGRRFSNFSATGPVTFALPPAAPHLEFEFVRLADQGLFLLPAGNGRINDLDAGAALELLNTGDCVRLGYAGPGRWYTIRSNLSR